MKDKILITCKDPASANDLLLILKNKLFKKEFDINIIAENPAFNILKLNKINYPVFKFRFDVSEIRNKKNFTKFILKFKPKKILTGISNNGYGVDEVATFIGNKFKIKTYAIQSYWGDINNKLKSLPSTIFVADKLSKKITKKKNSKANIKITGSLRVENLININVADLKNKFRKKNKINNNQKIVIFFGQPLMKFNWYFESVKSTIDKFQQINSEKFIFFYKLHPKENRNHFLRQIIKKYKNNFKINILNQNYPYIECICGSDILISCFSTVNYEAQILIAKEKKLFTLPVYINPAPLNRWFKREFGLDEIPYSDKYLSLKITNDYNVIEFIKNRSYIKKILFNIMKKIKIPKTDPIKNIITVVSK